MVCLERSRDKLHAGVELGGAARVVAVEQARVAAQLAQFRELREDLQLRSRKILGQLLGDAARELARARPVQLVLFAGHLRVDDVLVFLG